MAAAGGLAAGLVQLTGEEHGKASPTQRHAAVLGAGPQTEVVFLVKLALLRALGRPAQMLAAGQVDLQVGIAAVVLERSAVGLAQVGVHHVDKDVLAVNDGLAVFQRVQRVAVQPVDGLVQIWVQTLVAGNVIK